MEDFLSIIFFIIFFFGGFIIKLFKGYMEEIEREKAHKSIGEKKLGESSKTFPASRKIGGAEIFKRAPVSGLGQSAPKVPEAFADFGGVEKSRFSEYEEKLRALEAENLKKPILSGDICGDCYSYHESSNKTAELFKDRENLANAVIMSEILSKPLSLRNSRDLF